MVEARAVVRRQTGLLRPQHQVLTDRKTDSGTNLSLDKAGPDRHENVSTKEQQDHPPAHTQVSSWLINFVMESSIGNSSP